MQALNEIQPTAVLEVGDQLLLLTDREMSQAQVERLRTEFDKTFPGGPKIAVLCGFRAVIIRGNKT